MAGNQQNIIPSSQIDFLYNGLVSLFPELVYVDFDPEQIPPAKDIYFGLNQDKYKDVLIKSLNAFGINTFEEAVRIIKDLKIRSDKGEQVYGTLPINLEELVEFATEKKSPDEGKRAAEEIITQAKRRAELKRKHPQTKRLTEKDILETKPKSDEVFFESDEAERQVKLSKKQQEIVKLAQKDPKRFSDELSKRIIANNPQSAKDSGFLDSAEVVSFDFTKKLLEIDPKESTILIDNSPFEVLTFFANPQNPNLAEVVPDANSRKTISLLAQRAAFSLEKDNTLSANLIESALGPGWSPFYMPDKIRSVKATTSTTNNSGGSVKMQAFLSQMSNFMASEKRIWDMLKKENPDLILNLTRQEKAKLDKEVKDAAKKVVSISSAFSFLTSRRAYLPPVEIPATKHETGWLQAQWGAMGVPNLSQGSLAFIPQAVGGFETQSMLLSPAMNIAFDKFITRIPAVTKLRTVTAGLGSKITAKIAATKIGGKLAASAAANVIPVVGHIISVVTAILSLKDIAVALKKYFNEHPEALAVALGAPLVLIGYFSGVPFFAYTGFFGGLSLWALRRSLRRRLLRGPVYYFKRFMKFLLETIVGGIALALAIYIGSVLIISGVLYIINSGAYIYPPSSGSAINAALTGEVESPYIKVTKTPSEPGPFENSNLPLTIEYTVTVVAKKGVLRNVQIRDSCNAIQEGGTLNCPEEEPSIPTGTQVGEISPSTPYTFSYTRTYTSSFTDVLVVDTISVRAEVETGAMSEDTASVVLKIGDPPDDCPSIWPVTGSYLITQGPFGRGCTHGIYKLEAIDIATPTGTQVVSTHNGVVADVKKTTGGYRPYYIDISSTCGGVPFISRYAHLSAVSVTTGQFVTVGQVIGASGEDGTGPHLHYEFRGLKMTPPYIPKDVTYGCCDNMGACGYTNP